MTGLGLAAVVAAMAAADTGDDAGPWWVAGSDAYFYTTHAHAPTLMASLRAAHMNTFFVDAKDERGDVAWTSQAGQGWPVPFAFDPGDGPVERAVRAAQEGTPRLAVAARYATFQDEAQAQGALAHARIGDTRWLDPACPGVVEHVLAQVLDLLASTRVDEVNLDFLRYPAWGDVGLDVALPCTGGSLLDEDPTRFAHIEQATRRVVAAVRAAHPDVVVSGDLFGYTCHEPMVDIGQDYARLAPLLDWAMPMLYPAFFAPPGGLLPYHTVRDATAACIAQLGGDADRVKPWVQGFDHLVYPYGNNVALVRLQLQAVRDAGGTGAAVWWMETYGAAPLVGPLPGAEQVFWVPLADTMPPDWLHRPYRG